MMTLRYILPAQIMILLFVSQSYAQLDCKTVLIDSGVTFHIPKNWESVPKDVLTQYSTTVSKAMPSIGVQVYDYGFQKMPSAAWLSHPYVLVQIKRTGRVPESELKKYRAINKSLAESAKELESHSRSFLSDVRMGETVYDDSTHTLWMTMQSKVTGVGDVDAIICARLTEFGVIQIMGYSKHESMAENGPIFETIINSAEIDEKIAYKPRLSDSIPRVFGIDLVQLGISALIGAIIGAVMTVLAKKKKSKSKGQTNAS